MVAGFGTRAEGPFQVSVSKMPKITPWRFSQQDSFKVTRQSKGFQENLRHFSNLSKTAIPGPLRCPHKQPYNHPSVSTGDWFQNP